MKIKVLVIVVLISPYSHGFIDLGDAAEKAADSAAIVAASGELIREVDSESKKISEMEKDIRHLREKLDDTETFGRSTKNILSGPKTSLEDTSSRISSITSYVRDLKHYYSKYFGGVVSAEANIAIDNMRKSKQELREKNEEAKRSLAKTHNELKKAKKIKDKRDEDLKYRKSHNDRIKSILGIGQDV